MKVLLIIALLFSTSIYAQSLIELKSNIFQEWNNTTEEYDLVEVNNQKGYLKINSDTTRMEVCFSIANGETFSFGIKLEEDNVDHILYKTPTGYFVYLYKDLNRISFQNLKTGEMITLYPK